MYKNYIKNIFDFVFASVIFILAIPIFLIVTLILTLVNKGNPFFLQERPGRKEKLFKVIKFKTMTNEKDDKGFLLPDEKRLTAVGKFIRKTSIDEIPQLLNVIKGDMSLIGPRPLLIQYLPLYNENQKRRHEIKPGITGWAQINGRNAISWKKKFEYDEWYVDNVSILLDLKIIIITIFRVFKSDGINELNQATVRNFEGNE